VSVRGILADLLLKPSRELLIFEAGGRVFHASNSTKHPFESKLNLQRNLFPTEVRDRV
jgi:hypothetical protein